MSTRRKAPKNRYRTVLPSFINLTEHEEFNGTWAKVDDKDQLTELNSVPELEQDLRLESTLDDYPRHEVQSAYFTPESKQAMLHIDSLLPYRRVLEEDEIENRVRLTEFLTQQHGSTSSETTSRTLDPETETSKSSSNASPELKSGRFDLSAEDSFHRLNSRQNADSLPPDSGLRSGQLYTEFTTKAGSTNVKSKTITKAPQPSAISHRDAERSVPVISSAGHSYPRTSIHEPGFRKLPSTQPHKHNLARGEISLELLKSTLTAVPTNSVETSTTPRTHPRPTTTTSGVNYELVEGVRLDTQPKSAREQQRDLPIPEIEARDIRHIPFHHNNQVENTQKHDFESAGSIARFDESRASVRPEQRLKSASVPHRSVSETRVHPSTDRKATTKQQRISDWHLGLEHNNLGKCDQAVQNGLSQQSVDPSFSNRVSPLDFPSPKSMEATPRHLHEGVTEHFSSDVGGAANPPPVASSKEFKEHWSKLDRGVEKAKSLMTGMIA